MIPDAFACAMLLALVADVLIGWPETLFLRIGHPVTWIGRLISVCEKMWNAGDARRRRVAGTVVALVVIFVVVVSTWYLTELLPGGWLGVVMTGVLAWPLVAARSLYEHVHAVAEPLMRGDEIGARTAISRIVGRNPETLDPPAMSRAALESLAENASDGVIAPLFWGALFGLPGIAGYKAVNTLDSMIGYRNERYRDFGRAAAKIDDVANWVPARLTGGLIAAVSKARGTAFRTMRRDARAHRSPNAGWPEAAMAGALGVRLSGPRVYDGTATDDPWLNGVAADPRPEDVMRGLHLFRRAIGAFGLLLLLAALV